MSRIMHPSLLYLIRQSSRGRVRMLLSRLKQPKYAMVSIGVLLWLSAVMLPQFMNEFEREREPIYGLLIAGGMLMMQWLLNAALSSKRGLGFSPAETESLFAMPLSERDLMTYRLLRNSAQIVVSALILSLIFWANKTLPNFWLALPGFFLVQMFGVELYLILTLLKLRRSIVLLRVLLVVLCLTPLLSIVPWYMQAGVEGLQAFWTEMRLGYPQGESNLPLPVTALFFLAQAAAPLSFVQWIAPFSVLLVMNALGLFMVRHLATGFQEFELGAAQVAQESRRAMMSGRGKVKKDAIKPSRFKLRATGPGWRAIAWKNLVSQSRASSLKLIIGLIYVVILMGLIGVASAREFGVAIALGIGLAALAGMVTLGGSTFMTEDIRTDLVNIDLLKSLPMRSGDLVRAQALPLVWGLSLIAALLLTFGALAVVVSFIANRPLNDFGYGELALTWLCCVSLVYPLQLFMYGLDSVLTCLLPSWFMEKPDADPNQGLEKIGSQMLVFMAKGLGILVGLILPGLVAFGAFALAQAVKSPVPLLPGALLVAVIAYAEARLCFWIAGRAFESIDASREG